MARTESETLTLDGHEVTITNPGKVFFEEAGITKHDLTRRTSHAYGTPWSWPSPPVEPPTRSWSTTPRRWHGS